VNQCEPSLVNNFEHFQAKTSEDAEEGLLFMQEMIELSKQQSSQPDTPPKMVSFEVEKSKKLLFAGPAQFGRQLVDGFTVNFLSTLTARFWHGCTGKNYYF
jgi:hypothetical protein